MSNTVSIHVKWQKETFSNVEIDLTKPPSVFKTQLFSLTGVPPERQKIIGFKGGLLKDDADWTAVGAKNGLKVTMMGTADKAPTAPQKEQVFLEDLPVEEQDTTGLSKYGAGLENLGNTCYMNSTLQCLYNVPELKTVLNDFKAPPQGDQSKVLTSAAGTLFAQMDKSAQPVSPMAFVMTLRGVFPQFDQRSREGYHMQQDAEECWGALLHAMRTSLSSSQGDDEIQNLFGIQTRSVLKSEETDETMEVCLSCDSLKRLYTNYSLIVFLQIHESQLLLKCNIDSTVNHLSEGLKLGLCDDREKTSASLGRLVKFAGEASIVSLPPYLTIQMVRFYYKADIQQKAKILRKVAFPLLLDLYDLCDGSLKEQLNAPRLAFKEIEDIKAGVTANKKQKTDTSEKIDVASHAGALTGRYELIGVLTHKGRSADSGHYVSWTKHHSSDGQWGQFDDDKMILRKDEEVLALSGGGDWHMAYLLLYKAQKVPSSVPIPPQEGEKETTGMDME